MSVLRAKRCAALRDPSPDHTLRASHSANTNADTTADRARSTSNRTTNPCNPSSSSNDKSANDGSAWPLTVVVVVVDAPPNMCPSSPRGVTRELDRPHLRQRNANHTPDPVPPVRTGRCLCGEVEHEPAGDPAGDLPTTTVGHCEHCQRQSSGAFSVKPGWRTRRRPCRIATGRGSVRVRHGAVEAEQAGSVGQVPTGQSTTACGDVPTVTVRTTVADTV